MPEDTTHPCPGCEQPGVPRHQLACRPCWAKLPSDLKNAVNGTFRRRLADPAPHRRAAVAAYHWYRTNH